MQKKLVLCGLVLLLGLLLFSEPQASGAITYPVENSKSAGFFLILASMGIFTVLSLENNLTQSKKGKEVIESQIIRAEELKEKEKALGHHFEALELIIREHTKAMVKSRGWSIFAVHRESIRKDINEGYLSYGATDSEQNKRDTYEEQFYEGHAAGGGRVIKASTHLFPDKFGKLRLYHFNEPANSRYVWTIDEDGNFNVANRHFYLHEMGNMNKSKVDEEHRLTKLPHPTLAKGRHVVASGEMLLVKGKLKEFNTNSGHYYDREVPEKFNSQGREVFEYVVKMLGWSENPKYVSKERIPVKK